MISAICVFLIFSVYGAMSMPEEYCTQSALPKNRTGYNSTGPEFISAQVKWAL